MNTKQISYILELSQTLNFNRAAENLYISQPTLTYQIKAVEEEIGFQIFHRSGKGAVLTPAGFQFCLTLRAIQTELQDAIEQGQNFSRNFTEDIRIALPLRSAIHKLPQGISQFAEEFPSVSITPKFYQDYSLDAFLAGSIDIFFALEETVRRVPDIITYKLYESPFYLITRLDDPLAAKNEIELEDLAGRTLMIGGGSPGKLKALQQYIIHNIDVEYFNSQNHDTTLTHVASGRGICIAPGFLNDHTGEFAWIPVHHPEHFNCLLCIHQEDQRKSVRRLVEILVDLYSKENDSN